MLAQSHSMRIVIIIVIIIIIIIIIITIIIIIIIIIVKFNALGGYNWHEYRYLGIQN
jgi:hypothetical protein